MLRISVGVCAYNEERNIGACLESIIIQGLSPDELCEVIVVSSGSTDGTDEIVERYVQKDRHVQLIRQERREGKNSAINQFISVAKGDILVLVNADNRLAKGALQDLLVPFDDEKVGMVGGHPIPVNTKGTVVGFAVHMIWEMHHQVALIHPKAGELVAFRRPDQQLPLGMQSDEDIIRMRLEKRGYRTAYAPDAIVYNKGPSNLHDFIRQRTRVNIGEKYMKRWFDYDIPTWDARFLFRSFVSFLRANRRQVAKIVAAVLLEAYARSCASLYVKMDKGDKAVWQQVSSTKDLSGAKQ